MAAIHNNEIPEKTPIETIEILSPDDFLRAKEFIALGEKLNCKNSIRYAVAHKSWKCAFSAGKPSRVIFTMECTPKKWKIKANLWNIDAYTEILSPCSEKIKTIIKTAYDCKSCSDRCKGGAAFTFENISYKKCNGCCFYFSDLEDDDWRSLRTLIQKEHEARN